MLRCSIEHCNPEVQQKVSRRPDHPTELHCHGCWQLPCSQVSAFPAFKRLHDMLGMDAGEARGACLLLQPLRGLTLVYSWTQRAGFQLVIMQLALRHGTLSSLRVMCGSQTLFSTQH